MARRTSGYSSSGYAGLGVVVQRSRFNSEADLSQAFSRKWSVSSSEEAPMKKLSTQKAHDLSNGPGALHVFGMDWGDWTELPSEAPKVEPAPLAREVPRSTAATVPSGQSSAVPLPQAQQAVPRSTVAAVPAAAVREAAPQPAPVLDAEIARLDKRLSNLENDLKGEPGWPQPYQEETMTRVSSSKTRKSSLAVQPLDWFASNNDSESDASEAPEPAIPAQAAATAKPGTLTFVPATGATAAAHEQRRNSSESASASHEPRRTSYEASSTSQEQSRTSYEFLTASDVQRRSSSEATGMSYEPRGTVEDLPQTAAQPKMPRAPPAGPAAAREAQPQPLPQRGVAPLPPRPLPQTQPPPSPAPPHKVVGPVKQMAATGHQETVPKAATSPVLKAALASPPAPATRSQVLSPGVPYPAKHRVLPATSSPTPKFPAPAAARQPALQVVRPQQHLVRPHGPGPHGPGPHGPGPHGPGPAGPMRFAPAARQFASPSVPMPFGATAPAAQMTMPTATLRREATAPAAPEFIAATPSVPAMSSMPSPSPGQPGSQQPNGQPLSVPQNAPSHLEEPRLAQEPMAQPASEQRPPLPQATALYPSPASCPRPETQRQPPMAVAVPTNHGVDFEMRSREGAETVPVPVAAASSGGGSCTTSVASSAAPRGPDRMLNKLLAQQPCSTRLQSLQRVAGGYASPAFPPEHLRVPMTLAHPAQGHENITMTRSYVAAPQLGPGSGFLRESSNVSEAAGVPLQFQVVQEGKESAAPLAPRGIQTPMCGSASVPTAPWVLAGQPPDMMMAGSRSAAQLLPAENSQRLGPMPNRCESAPSLGLFEPVTLAAAEPVAASPLAIPAQSADFETTSSTRSPTWVSALNSFADPLEVGKPVRDWTEEDVAQWLTKLSTVPSDILDVVHLHAISGAVLLSLTEEDLESLRIEKFGHRRLLLLAAQELRRAVQVGSDRASHDLTGPGVKADFTVAHSPSSSLGSGAGRYSACVPQGRVRVLSPSPALGAQSVPVSASLALPAARQFSAPRSWTPQMPFNFGQVTRNSGPAMLRGSPPNRGVAHPTAAPVSPPPHLRPQVAVSVQR